MQRSIDRADSTDAMITDTSTMLPDDDIVRIVNESDADVEKAAKALVDEANERGGEDNITVLLMKFEAV